MIQSKTLLLAAVLPVLATAGGTSVQMIANGETGGLGEITISGNATGMNWTQRGDGKELSWVTPCHRWGTGTLKADGQACKWPPGEVSRSAGERPVLGHALLPAQFETEGHRDDLSVGKWRSWALNLVAGSFRLFTQIDQTISVRRKTLV